MNSPAQLPEVASMDGTFTSIWRIPKSNTSCTMQPPAIWKSCTVCRRTAKAGPIWASRDGSLYFMHSVTTDNGGTTPSSIDKLENGTMTPVSEIAAQHDDVKPVIEDGELQWVTQMKQWSTIEDEIDLYVFDLSDGQTSRIGIQMDAAKVWDTGARCGWHQTAR